MKKYINNILLLFAFILLLSACKPKHPIHLLPNDEIYTCPNDVHVIDDHPAKCPDDGAQLVRKRITEEQRELLITGKYERAKE